MRDRIKRAIDVVAASLLLILLSPLLAGIAALLWLTSGRPVIFTQPRPGRDGRAFRLLKFRTMNDRRADDGTPLPDEARLTRVGRALRSTSLDELPELYNVLRGDMSLVGPRPLLMEYLPLYTAEQARRHEVRPGITGWAQVNGRNALTWEEKFQHDTWYVDHRSTRLDLLILWRTVGQVLTRRGIAAPGSVTMERFRGTPPVGDAPARR
ncbi:MAG TPA: sugar transferase [Acidimicrobiia bacterium]|nr:sugar transferase [Acidimicrobiia bacterium]